MNVSTSVSASVQARRKLPFTTYLLMSLVLIVATGCSVFGGASVEEAPYQLVQKDGQYEIRDYAPLIVAETRVDASVEKAGSKAFRTLFAYISGENEGSEKIAMTAPVTSETQNGGSDDSGESGDTIAMTAPVTFQQNGDVWRYRFVLPQQYSLKTAPQPSNPDVKLIEIEPKRVAAIQYNWLATDKARSRNTQALNDWIQSQGLDALSEPRFAGYNPPWTLPPFRRNEVLVDIAGE